VCWLPRGAKSRERAFVARVAKGRKLSRGPAELLEPRTRQIAQILSPDEPSKSLLSVPGGPRSTVRSWATGHCRAPIAVLKLLREGMMMERQAALLALAPELNHQIMKREAEPTHRTGFCTIDPLTGMDMRNRVGRPKRI
jgi:hypothetical protein